MDFFRKFKGKVWKKGNKNLCHPELDSGSSSSFLKIPHPPTPVLLETKVPKPLVVKKFARLRSFIVQTFI